MAPTKPDIEVEVDIHASTTHTYRARQTRAGTILPNTSHHALGSFADHDEDLERVLRESAAQAEEDEAHALERLLEESRAEAERAAAVDEAAELAAALTRSQLDALTEEEMQLQQLLQQSREEFFNSQNAQGADMDDDEALLDAIKKRSVEDWHKCTWDQKPPAEGNWSDGSGVTTEERFQTTTSYTHRSAAKGVGMGTMVYTPGVGMVPAAHPIHPYALSGPAGYPGGPFGGGGGPWPRFPSHGQIPGAPPGPARSAASAVPTAWTQGTHVSHRHYTPPSSTATTPSSAPSAPGSTGAASPPDCFESSGGKGCHSAAGPVADTAQSSTENTPRPGTATPAATVRSFGKQSVRSTPQSPASASPVPPPLPPVDDPNLVHVLSLVAEEERKKEGPQDPMDIAKQEGDQKSVHGGSVADKESKVKYRKEDFEELKKLVLKEKKDADTNAGGDGEGSWGGEKAGGDEKDGGEEVEEPDDPDFVKGKRLAFLEGLEK